jgi:hypothetical protein
VLPPHPARLLLGNSKSALDRRVDQALDQTFPASDPVSVICTAYPARTRQRGAVALSTMKAGALKPDIIVSEADERSLTRLAADVVKRSPELGEVLLAEIERASARLKHRCQMAWRKWDRSLSLVRKAAAPGGCS